MFLCMERLFLLTAPLTSSCTTTSLNTGLFMAECRDERVKPTAESWSSDKSCSLQQLTGNTAKASVGPLGGIGWGGIGWHRLGWDIVASRQSYRYVVGLLGIVGLGWDRMGRFRLAGIGWQGIDSNESQLGWHGLG